MVRPRNATTRPKAVPGGPTIYKSSSEKKVAAFLTERGVTFSYEGERLEYVKPARLTSYTPDFNLENGVTIEVKGWWDGPNRQMIAMVKRQHPTLDLRILFDKPETPINKGSSTTYAKFCDGLGIPWAQGPTIPDSWLLPPKGQT